MRRVAITGLGTICALGKNVPEFWERLAGGCPAIHPIEGIEVSQLRFQLGAQVRGYDPAAHFGQRQDLLDRFAQFGVIAAREAIADAAISITPDLSPHTAVIAGSSLGGQSTEDAGFEEIYRRGGARVHPLTIPKAMMNASVSQICMELGITGPAMTISTACASASHAIGQAFWMVRSGLVDLAITGGSEAPFSFGVLKAWEAMRVVAPDPCRPFSKERKGMTLGEGAAMLVLEPLDRARQRGATIYGEIAGFGMSSDAHHITQPTEAGPAQAMRSALADAGLPPGAVGYINAHGTGTPVNDVVETRAIQAAFGEHAVHVRVSSTKSMHGHALGAAGALEAVATVLALYHQTIPPTCNFTAPDPECNLNLVVNRAELRAAEYALSNSFAFGGLNAVLAFRSPGS
jgi:nodulation protein E